MGYRFNPANDILVLFESLSSVLKEYSSLKHLFLSSINNSEKNIIGALGKFTGRLNRDIKKKKGTYTHYMITQPNGGSTCKRMNLFLRWMVRKDEIDTGIWNEAGTGKLIMPVDTHIARISKHLRQKKKKSIDLKYAVELTERLKSFDASDPVKYDFALCHIGIDGRNF